MRQWVAVAAVLAFCALPLTAQRGGRGGFNGGFGASRGAPGSSGIRVAPAPRVSGSGPSFGRSPSFSGPRVGYAGPRVGYAGPRPGFVGPRSGYAGPRAGYVGPRYIAPRPGYVGARPMHYGRGFSAGFRTGGLHVGFNSGFRGRRFHHFRSSYLFPIPLYYSYFPSPYYDPFALGYSYPYSYYSYPEDPFGYRTYSASPDVTYVNQGLSDQMSNLGAEVQQLREDNQALRNELNEQQYEQQYAPQAPPASAPAARSSQETLPPTVLVMRDGRRIEVRNYAIVGQSLWVLYDQPAMRIPLSDLDLNQTTKANEDRGVRFMLPPSASAKP